MKFQALDLNRIALLAQQLRQAIERCPKEDLVTSLQEFPKGSCGDATLLLGWHLRQNDIADTEYVCGKRRRRSHAWLSVRGVIVDITGDQFNEGLPPVFVGIDSIWHKSFKEDFRHDANLLNYDEHTKFTLMIAYSQLAQYINSQKSSTTL